MEVKCASSKDRFGPLCLCKGINKALEVKMIVGRSGFLSQMRDAGGEGKRFVILSFGEAPAPCPAVSVPLANPAMCPQEHHLLQGNALAPAAEGPGWCESRAHCEDIKQGER